MDKNELVGKTIASVREMTDAEQAQEGWMHKTIVIVLDDGSILYPSRDPEGNGPGILFGDTGTELFALLNTRS